MGVVNTARVMQSSFSFSIVPGPPVRLVFPEVRLTEVRVVWQPPVDPNGIIMGKRNNWSILFLLYTDEM